MRVAVLLFVAVYITQDVDAQIPIPCANIESLTKRECCPTPDPKTFGDSAGPCGSNLAQPRGFCTVTVDETKLISSETDVRKNWPVQYFNSTCVCEENFGGFDCGECNYAYNDGTTKCTVKTIRPRKSVSAMTPDDWKNYINALKKAKTSPSRYSVVTSFNSPEDLQGILDSMKNLSHYDLFIWIHHTVARDNDFTTDPKVDFAHEGPGFPTWHRLLLLWLEREIQREIEDHLFRIPYWDWRNPADREKLFQKNRLGENNDGRVVGDLFENWQTICWQDPKDKNYPIKICDPDEITQPLRRCPSPTLCMESNENWPSYGDVDRAVSIEGYDSFPYTRYVKDTNINEYLSFRNYMEGFITKPGKDCGQNSLCTTENDGTGNVTVERKLHNTVHIILGVGDFRFAKNLSFEQTGVMADVAASPNDPIFVNHHVTVDCILEEWLQRNKDDLDYPTSENIREGYGHRADEYITPIIPLYMQKEMFKTADNFGYYCSNALLALPSYTILVLGLLVVTVLSIV